MGLFISLTSSGAKIQILRGPIGCFIAYDDTVAADNGATVDTDTLGTYAVGDLIWSGREAMYVSAVGAYPPTIGVTRSQLGTARRDELDDYQIFSDSNSRLK